MRRTSVAIAVLIALLFVGATAAAPGGRVLVVEDAETGEQYLQEPVDDGTIVALEYMHSVEKTRVYDEYTVRGDHLEMTRMEFESFGWGLPSGANVTREDGVYVFDPPGNYTRITVAPGEVAGHKLHVGAESYDLVARTNGQSVHIHVARRSAFDAVRDQLNT